MTAPSIRKLLLNTMLLLACLPGSVFAQQLVNGDTLEMNLCRVYDAAVLQGPVFASGNHGTFDGWALVTANGLVSISIINEMSAIPGGKYITVSNAGGLVDSSSDSGNSIRQNISGPLLVHIHVDSNKLVPGTSAVIINLMSDSCHSIIWNIESQGIIGDSILMSFQCVDTTVLVGFDDHHLVPVQTDAMSSGHIMMPVPDCGGSNTFTLTTVADSGNHCCHYTYETLINLTCNPMEGCFDAADLHADHVTCLYSTFFSEPVNYGIIDPESLYGIVDSSELYRYSRHTVMRDTTLYDATLGGTWLRTVCPGCDSTVRLGNSLSGGEWEAINYALTVDTMIGGILILKYAAVLQNPNHPANDQPRFTFDLFDTYMQPIENPCAHAEFIASDSLGWNSINDIEWKNWTSVGFDLSDYHGQTLNLRLKTSDCTQGAHFGYAYYTTQCTTRNITALQCGVTDSNTFSAPEGFNYQWTNTAGAVISTDRTITVPSSGDVYHCRVSSIEDPACYFELGTYAGVRLPKAAGRVEQVRTTDCHTYDVKFRNESYITSDGVTPVPYGGACDEIIWHFGDGDSAISLTPTHTYTDTGTYNVAVIASLNGGQCIDTAYLTVSMPTVFDHEEELTGCDSLRWRDGEQYTVDTLGATHLVTHPALCDTLYTLNLHINHASYGNLQFDTICHNQAYLWNDTLIVMPADSTRLTLCDTLLSVAGCDSSVILYLETWPDFVAELEHDTVCYGQSYTWRNFTVNDTSQQQTLLCIGLRDTMMTIHNCDSVVGLDLCRWPLVDFGFTTLPNCSGNYHTLSVDHLYNSMHLFMYEGDSTLRALAQDDTLAISVDSLTVYRMTAGYTDSMFCATDTTFILRPILSPEAALKLTPKQLTYENLTLHAYDITNGDYRRHWAIVHADGDSLALPDTAAHLVYTADLDDDSTRVVLIVSNGTCADTVTGCSYLLRTNFFAPNVFTPGQTDNSHFVIIGTGIRQHSLSIFNRQGLLVFATDQPEEGWDGTHEGTPCMQGAYVWHLTYSSILTPNRTQTAVGTVTLLR